MKAKRKSKNKHSLVLFYTIILLLILIFVLVLTLALFTSFDEVTNVFIGGRIDIVLTEPNWKPGDGLNLVPDATIDKDPYVTNNEDLPVYVFLKVTVPAVKYNFDSNIDTDKGSKANADLSAYVPVYKFVTVDGSMESLDTTFSTVQLTNQCWQPLENYPKLVGEGNSAVYEYVYYYSDTSAILSELPSGKTTIQPLFDRIHLLNLRNDSDYIPNRNYHVVVEAYGIQTRYLGNNGSDTNDPVVVWKKIESN